MTELTNATPHEDQRGFSVPTREELMPGMRPMHGMYVDIDSGEAVFIPTAQFMRQSALWRLDVLGDIAHDIERVRQHALAEYFGDLDRRVPGLPSNKRQEAFRNVCDESGVELPQNAEAVLAIAVALTPKTNPSPD